MNGWARCAAVGAVTVVLAPTLARADEAALRLRWSAPPECPGEDVVRAAVLHGVDRDRLRAPLDAEAVVERIDPASEGKAWRLRLRTRREGVTGEREIEASSCSGVADGAAVLLAMAMTGPTEAPAERATRAEPVKAEADVSRPAGSPEHVFAIGASGALDSSTLPSAAVGAELAVAWTPGRARIEVDGRVWSSQSAGISASDAGARFSLTSVGGRACWAIVHGPVDVSPCAGADVSFAAAKGFGSEQNFDRHPAWTSVTLGGLARLPLASWLSLRGRAEAAVPVSRPTFVVRNEGDLHRPAAVSLLAVVGLEANFL